MATAESTHQVSVDARSSSLSRSSIASTSRLAMTVNVDKAETQPISPSSSGGGHCRDRSHFSIPDVMITACDEEGQPSHFEVQLEEAKRRAPLSPIESNIPTAKGAQKQAASRRARENSKASAGDKGSAKGLKALRRKRAPSTKSMEQATLPAREMLPLPVDDPKSPTNYSVFSFESNSSESNGEESPKSPFARRVGKSSMPSLFTRKDRDVAHAGAIKDLPTSSGIKKLSLKRNKSSEGKVSVDVQASSPIGTSTQKQEANAEHSDPVHSAAFVAADDKPTDASLQRKTSSTASTNEAPANEDAGKKDKRMTRLITRRLSLPSLVRAKPASSPTSPGATSSQDEAVKPLHGRPSRKARKAREREEEELLKEWQRLDKLVRKHDAKVQQDERKSSKQKRSKAGKGKDVKEIIAATEANFAPQVLEQMHDDGECAENLQDSDTPIESTKELTSRSSSQNAELSCLLDNVEQASAPLVASLGEAEASGQSTPRPMSVSKISTFNKTRSGLFDNVDYEPPRSAPPTTLAFDSLYRNIEDMEHSFVRKHADTADSYDAEPFARYSQCSIASGISLSRSLSLGASVPATTALRTGKPSEPLPALPRSRPTALIGLTLPTMSSDLSIEELARSLMADGFDIWAEQDDSRLSMHHMTQPDPTSSDFGVITLEDSADRSDRHGWNANQTSTQGSVEVGGMAASVELLGSVDSSAGSSACAGPLTPPQHGPLGSPQRRDLRMSSRDVKASTPLRKPHDVPQLVITQSDDSRYSASLDQLDFNFPSTPPREPLPPSPTRSSPTSNASPTSPSMATPLPAATAALLAGRKPVRVGAHPTGFSFPPRTASY